VGRRIYATSLRDTAAGVHRSFVGSPRLRQGLRRLRMTVAEKANARNKGKTDFKRLRRLRDADIDDRHPRT
jgi:hypothetical protein